MKQVVIDKVVREKLNGLSEELALADSSGKTLGYFIPPEIYSRMLDALLSQEPTPEELEAGRLEYREKGGRTTAEVLAHLTKVKQQWEEGRK